MKIPQTLQTLGFKGRLLGYTLGVLFFLANTQTQMAQSSPSPQSDLFRSQWLMPVSDNSTKTIDLLTNASDRDFLVTYIEKTLVKPKTSNSQAAQSRSLASTIAQTILTQSKKYHFDPVLVASVIATESRFRVNAQGQHKEQGLMQLRPDTAAWIAENTDEAWTAKMSLFDPATNIKLGVAYLALLRKEFGENEVFLSAYNLGPNLTRRFVKKQIVPKIYTERVLRNYAKLIDARTAWSAEKLEQNQLVALQKEKQPSLVAGLHRQVRSGIRRIKKPVLELVSAL